MKDNSESLDELLKSRTVKPSRPLSDNFTQKVMVEIKASKQTAWTKIAQIFHLQHAPKAVMALLAVLVVTGGTVAAVMLWPTPKVTPTITKQLPSGNRIVGIRSSDCSYITDLQDNTLNNNESFYEIHKDSKLTDEDVIRLLQGECEGNLSNEALTAIKDRYLPKETLVQSTPTFTITAITKDSLTVETEAHDKSTIPVHNFTFSHFSKELIVQDKTQKSTYDTLKVGDTVKMFVQDSSSNEGTEGHNLLSHEENLTVLVILKTPPLTADPYGLQVAVGVDIVRLERCSISSTGFCRAYEFFGKQDSNE